MNTVYQVPLLILKTGLNKKHSHVHDKAVIIKELHLVVSLPFD